VDAVPVEISAAGVPRIRVVNKVDLSALPPGVERDACGTISTVRLSALTGAGCEGLLSALAERFPADARHAPAQPEVAT